MDWFAWVLLAGYLSGLLAVTSVVVVWGVATQRTMRRMVEAIEHLALVEKAKGLGQAGPGTLAALAKLAAERRAAKEGSKEPKEGGETRREEQRVTIRQMTT